MRARGFTLVEVMVALVLFAMAAIVLSATYINVLSGYEHVRQATQVDADVRFAREILFRQPDRDKVEEGGEFEAVDGRRVEWKAKLEPTNVADLFTVDFEVNISGNAELDAKEVHERFRLLRPTWSEDSDREQLRKESQDRIAEYLQRRPQ